MSDNKSDGLNEESTDENGEGRKASEWTIEMQERLLQFIQQTPCLYNRESPAFRDKIIKQDAWNLIGKNLNITGDEASKHFTFLREKFGRCLRARRTGKLGKSFTGENFPIGSRMEFLKNHIVQRRRRPADADEDEFEEILGSEQSYEDFSFNGLVSATEASGTGSTTQDNKRKSDSMDNESSSDEIGEVNSEVQIVESRSLQPAHNDQKIKSSASSTRSKLTKLESESILSDKLRGLLDRGTAGHENSPNYLFGMYVTSKLDKMSPQDASTCTFRIHEILFQTESGKFNKPLAHTTNSNTLRSSK